MYTHLFVALDGSELAERVLPHVAALAQQFGSTVTLVRASRPPSTIVTAAAGDPLLGVVDPTPIVQDERHEALEYLVARAKQLGSRGLQIGYEQPEGPAGEVIVQRARELGADLIAMTTHGRGGLGRVIFGSVADEVLRHAPCPILLVRVSDRD
ncbi:MAG: universal stress protein [Chloroflexi bacterium]|nr:universal stress protein [Chloroflexota bacterium]